MSAVPAGETGLEYIQALIRDDMQAVDALIQEKLHSDIGLIDQLGHYIVNSGGKRLRPALVLLSANCFGYGESLHIKLAAVIEFIHTATLLHDDVVDASMLRRGKATANQRWGNEASVLVGDFLYSRAFQMMVEAGDMHVMEIMADATNIIAEGEVLQLINRHDPETTEQRYLQVIHNKTAKLFEAAARVGAVVAGQDRQTEQAMTDYGRHLGIAYQLIDDALDYSAPSDILGKNIGDDLAEGKTHPAAAVRPLALFAGTGNSYKDCHNARQPGAPGANPRRDRRDRGYPVYPGPRPPGSRTRATGSRRPAPIRIP